MFLPVGSAVRLRLPGTSSSNVVAIVGNRDRTFFAVLTADSLLIFQANPQLLLCFIRRSDEDIEEKGDNIEVFWRHDTSGICVSTSKKCLLVYRVDVDKQQCFNLREPRDVQLRRTSQELFIKENRPKVTIVLAVVVRLSSLAVCVVALREELFVCLQDGWLHRIRWNGTVEDGFSVHVSRVPFSIDQLQSRADFVSAEGCHVLDAVYSPLIGGFSVVLSDGRAALLTSPNPKFHPSELLAVWAGNMTDASCTATNHKFRLITFGCRNGDVAAYHLDETTGALVQAYRVALRVKDSPELLASVGSVAQLQWFAQGTALAAVWSAKGDKKLPIAAVFTAFGAQMWCSLEAASQREVGQTETYTSVDWGPEGYHLWLGSDRGVSIFPFVRFIGMNSPAMEHIDHVVMMGSNQIYVSPSRKLEQAASAPHGAWNMIQVPHDYLAANWPLRYCAVDAGPKTVLVAGSRGLAHFNLASNKWRLFGNESQEREMYVTGGVCLWRGFAVAACYDVDKEKDDLRFYPLSRQLDNQYCTRWFAEAQILMMNLRGDYLVTFDLDTRIYVYHLTKSMNKDFEAVDVTRCAEIRTSDLVPHPACTVSVQLTSLNHDSAAATFCPGVDTILVNVAGRLIMLSPQRQSDSSNDDEPFQLNQPMLVASYVEQVWHDLGSPAVDATNNNKPHLTQALWIQSGSRGMKVWMPLFPGRRGSMLHQDSSRSFISKRIMLPFELSMHPLVVCSRDCLALGVESVPYVPSTVRHSTSTTSDPSYNLHRNSEVFLHHILRQLLKRNLGLYALEIAGTCRHLPYFGHVLELLLHQVLEEEATSSEPIP
uniref:Protein RIC1 homolog n=1 Tax=Plectus sambesii TaxID=2011161 RepID=A0A914XEF7_9BILA